MGSYNVDATFNAINNMSPNVLSMVTDLNSLAVAAVGVAVAIGTTAFNAMEDMNKSMAGVAARTGASADELGLLKTHADALFNSGLVANFDDAARAVENAHTKLNYMLNDTDFSKFEFGAAGVAKAWGVTNDSVITDVQGIVNKFGDLKNDPIKALDLLTVTAQKSHLPLDQISSIINTYGSKFAAAGLSATDMGGLIVKAAQGGVTNFAGLATALDTFHKRASNPPAAFTAALKDMGMGQVVADLNANKITMGQALDQINAKFATMPDGPQKTNDAIALFGAGIDKVGGPDALAKITGISDALGNVSGAAGQVAVTISDDGTLGSALTRLGNRFKTEMGNDLDAFFKALKSGDWSGVAAIFNTGIDQAVAPFEDAFKVPGGTIITLEANLISGLESDVNGAATGVGNAFGAVANAAIGALQPIIDIINKIIGAIAALAGPAAKALGINLPNVAPISIAGHAMGTDSVAEGLFMVGEQGPELGYKSGNRVQIFSNSQSKKMLGSGGGSHGSSGTTNNFNGTYHLYGAGGMREFGRTVTKATQAEQNRRGTRQ